MRKLGNLSNSQREEWILKRIREGYGCGEYEYYKPWIDNYIFSSIGRSGTCRGNKIDRNFELFSDLERAYFYLLDFSKEVDDIREQFPLFDRKLVYEIAEELGIKPPYYVGSNVIYVMTTDFYLLKKGPDGIKPAVRTIKYSSELTDRRVGEKLALEEEYFKRKGIADWKVITEKDIDFNVVRNLKFFRKFYQLKNVSGFMGLNLKETAEAVGAFKASVPKKAVPIIDVLRNFDRNYSPGSGVKIYKHLLARKEISCDLKVPLNREDFIVYEKGGLRVINRDCLQ